MRSHCNTLDPRAFGVAGGVTAAAISGICAVALLIAPSATKGFVGYLIHSDLSGLTIHLTWASFVTGVIGWGFIAGLAFSAAAGLYNRFSSAEATAPGAAAARGVA